MRVAVAGTVVLGAPAHIRNTLPDSSLSIGELDGSTSERMVRLQKVFEKAGVKVRSRPGYSERR